MVHRGRLFSFAVTALCILFRIIMGTANQERLPLRAESLNQDDSYLHRCWNFTHGNPSRKEFYSPNYPRQYYNNTDCTYLLVAPIGHVIQVDFRDKFHMEHSEECKYDYLEVRDGAYGYSPIIGRYCGEKIFPRPLKSTAQYMWLRFHSDDTIEFHGFRALYTFIIDPEKAKPKNVSQCRFFVEGEEGTISSKDIPEDHKAYSKNTTMPVDCTWEIAAGTGSRISLSFLDYDMELANECRFNFIDIFDGTTSVRERVKTLCGSSAASVQSKKNRLFVRFFAKHGVNKSRFTALYTSFTVGKCVEGIQFDCGDSTCIDIKLVCNTKVNCKFGWDEQDCKHIGPTSKSTMAQEHMIIVTTIAGILFVIICISVCLTCQQKRTENEFRKRWSREHSHSSPPEAVHRHRSLSENGCTVPEMIERSKQRHTNAVSKIEASFTMLSDDLTISRSPIELRAFEDSFLSDSQSTSFHQIPILDENVPDSAKTIPKTAISALAIIELHDRVSTSSLRAENQSHTANTPDVIQNHDPQKLSSGRSLSLLERTSEKYTKS